MMFLVSSQLLFVPLLLVFNTFALANPGRESYLIYKTYDKEVCSRTSHNVQCDNRYTIQYSYTCQTATATISVTAERCKTGWGPEPHCNDFNECGSMPNPCAHSCTNTFGSYLCSCRIGYRLASDGQTCKERSPERQTSESQTLNDQGQTDDNRMSETIVRWVIVVNVCVVVGVALIIPAVVCFVKNVKKRKKIKDDNRQTKERRMSNPDCVYEDVGYDSIGFPLEEIAKGNKISKTRDSGHYGYLGYDSIDQASEEIGNREFAVTHSPGVDERNISPLDMPQRKAIGRERPTLDKDITSEDTGYLKPLEVLNTVGGNVQPKITDNESVRSESKNILKLNEQSESAVLNREEDNGKLDIIPKEVKFHSDLVSTELNPYLDLTSNEVNQSLDLVLTEVNPYLDLVSTDVNPYSHPVSPVSTEMNRYFDLTSKEVNPYLDLVSPEVNPYLDPVSSEVNLNMGLVSKEVNPYLDPVSTAVNKNMNLHAKE